MARAQATTTNQAQAPVRGHRTGTFARGQGFTPAQRITPPQRNNVRRQEVEEENDSEQQDEEMIQGSGPAPLTKSGYPDRRFKGQRDLPPPEEANPNFQRARTGGVMGNVHVTIDGKPDRRFKENRGLSDEDVMRHYVAALNQQFGQPQRK